MTWTELIDRLLKIQREKGYKRWWVVTKVIDAGHPPIEHWRRLMIELDYPFDWVGDIWRKHGQNPDPVPNSTAIDWAKWELPPTSEPQKVLNHKPILGSPKP